jgi:hypothetical protein
MLLANECKPRTISSDNVAGYVMKVEKVAV